MHLSPPPLLLYRCCLLLCLMLASLCRAEITIPDDARVGLVLSGGGARGLAHVGVLRVLEARGIEPDIITGTSMGSIVGALYASGRSVDDIDRIARSINWQRALSDASPRRDQPYPFRQLESGMNTDLRLSITRHGIAFPRGAIEGQHLEQTLAELFDDHNGRPLQFSDLPRRYAAVAADLEIGEAVAMQSGDVATAVRASMSIPGAIAPVERDGKLLVDGGIANNMPVDLARRMGADVIIAVDVSAPLKTRDELDSVFNIAQQVSGILVNINTRRQIEQLNPGDILITPDLAGYTSASFDHADPIIEAGVHAALTTFSMDATALPGGPDREMLAPEHAMPVIEFIRIDNDSAVSDRVMRAQIRQPLGEPLDRALLERDLSRLYGLDYFSTVRYRLVEDGDRTGLLVTGEGRATGTSWLRLGLELADDFEGNSVVGLAASLRAAGLNALGGTAFARLELGTNPEVELRYLQPLTPDLDYFIEPAIGYRVEQLKFYPDGQTDAPISEYRQHDTWGSLALGRLIWDGAGELRLGITRERGRLKYQGGVDLNSLGLDNTEYDDGYYFAQLGRDTLDDLGFPGSGQRWSIRTERHLTTLEAEDDFSRVELDGTFAFSHGRHTLLLEGDAQISDSDEAGFVDIPFLGGFLELSGLPPRSLFGRHRALVRSVYYARLTRSGPLPVNVPLYFGFSLERGNVWLDRDDIAWSDAIGAGSLFLGARTPLGPAYLSFGLTEDDDSSVMIFLGQRFR